MLIQRVKEKKHAKQTIDLKLFFSRHKIVGVIALTEVLLSEI
jgi:hypothetical protein